MMNFGCGQGTGNGDGFGEGLGTCTSSGRQDDGSGNTGVGDGGLGIGFFHGSRITCPDGCGYGAGHPSNGTEEGLGRGHPKED